MELILKHEVFAIVGAAMEVHSILALDSLKQFIKRHSKSNRYLGICLSELKSIYKFTTKQGF
jgi:hypothetical protein